MTVAMAAAMAAAVDMAMAMSVSMAVVAMAMAMAIAGVAMAVAFLLYSSDAADEDECCSVVSPVYSRKCIFEPMFPVSSIYVPGVTVRTDVVRTR